MEKPEISISTCFDYSIPIQKQLPMIAQAGFSHVSLGSNYDHSGLLTGNGIATLKELLDQNSLKIDTLHGVDLDSPDAIEMIRKLALIAQELHIPIMVVHCSAFDFASEKYTEKYNLVTPRIKELEALSAQTGIRFALENVVPGPPTKLTEELVKQSNPQSIGFCYDSSHDQIDGPRRPSLINRLKDRVIAVHLSDRIKPFVDHVLPGEGFIDFKPICEALQQTKLQAPSLFEVMIRYSQYKEPEEFLRQAHQRGAAIAERINTNDQKPCVSYFHSCTNKS